MPGFAPSLKKLTGRGETLRGRNPLYAINGVPQHTALRDGERDGHTIDLDFVDRIEVIHGANAIQGIGATGGVVNMVTKSPSRDGRWTHDVKLSFGNGDTFDRRGWAMGTSGNLSARLDGPEFVITASGRHKGRLTVDDFVVPGRPGERNKPSAETAIHEAIYRRLPETRAILHAHTVASTAASFRP